MNIGLSLFEALVLRTFCKVHFNRLAYETQQGSEQQSPSDLEMENN